MPTREGKRWRGIITIDNKRVAQKIFNRFSEAKKWEILERKNILERKKSYKRLLVDEFNKYIKQESRRRKESTIYQKNLYFGYFLESLEDQGVTHEPVIDDINMACVRESMEYVARTHSCSAANEMKSKLSPFWSWLMMCYEDIMVNPFHRVEKLKVPKSEKRKNRTPTLEEVNRLLANAGDDRLLLEVYIYTGARMNEVNNLKWKDIDWLNSRIGFHSSKTATGEEETGYVQVGGYLMERLNNAYDPREEFVFRNDTYGRKPAFLRYKLESIISKSGVRKIGFHGFRRFFGSTLASIGRPMREIQSQLRHKNLATTEKYVKGLELDLSKTVEAFDKSMEKATNGSAYPPLKLVHSRR